MSQRLDTALTDRGLVRSRSKAQELVDRGEVTVNGVRARKTSVKVAPEDVLAVTAQDWVSRSAPKLADALDRFGVAVEGRRALDVGACTGGFTQVLLARGAQEVVALDVGHGQLAPELAQDHRVLDREGVNAREMTVEDTRGPVDVVVSDVSFISLTYVLPRVPALLRGSDAEVVLLVKPQFEIGRSRLGRGGVVRDAADRREAVLAVIAAAEAAGLEAVGLMPATVRGQHGNQEYVLHLRPATAAGGPPESADDGLVPAANHSFWAVSSPTPQGGS